MGQYSRYQARWSKDRAGEAVLAIERDGVMFTARVKPDDCVPGTMAQALLDATAESVAYWVKSGKLRVAGRRRGRALYRLSDLLPIAQQRDIAPT